ncbi:NADP-dependent oxidoreductase domain-containing protein [Mycena latifolia]|nr:NADP-dependent oxidoreductase domain-containing protein [Mycena latifolia]
MSPPSTKIEYSTNGMPFRRLGSSGLRVPLLSRRILGGTVVGDPVKDIIKTAFENGINMFDTAETYADGKSEEEMGRVIEELGLRRTDLIISTKIFWGPGADPTRRACPASSHIIEGTKESLARLRLTYVDVVLAHRCDSTVPMEDIVRALNYVIEQGWGGTSEWTAQEIEEAHHIATKLNLIAPITEQCQHSMFERDRPEKEYAALYRKHGLGVMAFSPLYFGFSPGRYYNDGIPANSRFAVEATFKEAADELLAAEGREKIRKVKELTKTAEGLGSTSTALALAWVAKDPHTSTVILGVTSPEQLQQNLKALEVLPKLTDELMEQVDKILGNKAATEANYGRPLLDTFGRQ